MPVSVEAPINRFGTTGEFRWWIDPTRSVISPQGAADSTFAFTVSALEEVPSVEME